MLNPCQDFLDQFNTLHRFQKLGRRPIAKKRQRRRQPMRGFLLIAENSDSMCDHRQNPSDINSA